MTTETAADISTATPPALDAPTPRLAEPARGIRLSWGGVIGGLLVAIAVWLALSVLGLAVNLTALDPRNPAALQGIGMAAGLWSLVVWVVALFAGGVVAGHAAGIAERRRGALHGIVLWSLATMLSMFVVADAVRAVALGALMTTAPDEMGATGAALVAATSTGKALWWVFFAMLLGLGAALIGSTTGVGRRQRRIAAAPAAAVPVTPERPVVVPERPPLATTREAHP